MGICQMPTTKFYCCKDSVFNIPMFYIHIIQETFKLVIRFLHFVNHDELKKYETKWKLSRQNPHWNIVSQFKSYQLGTKSICWLISNPMKTKLWFKQYIYLKAEKHSSQFDSFKITLVTTIQSSKHPVDGSYYNSPEFCLLFWEKGE
jgi:hypothetical protein